MSNEHLSLRAVYGFYGDWFVYFISAATGTGAMFSIADGAFVEGAMSSAARSES
jgi:hypothetical protein